ncbi:MAG: DUF167 domain-containing protein [Acidimicrobiales bacterium]
MELGRCLRRLSVLSPPKSHVPSIALRPVPVGEGTPVKLEVHVRPGSSRTFVGGTHDGALVVRVVERAESGRATDASLRAVAEAVGVPARSVKLVRGVTSRRKLFEIEVGDPDSARIQREVDQLRERGPA